MLKEIWYYVSTEAVWLFERYIQHNCEIIWEEYVRPAGRRLGAAGFNIYVAANMMICAVLFCFWSRPRETISGFIGRNALTGSSVALHAARAIDKLYPNEPAHCGETALSEDEARFVLYPEEQVASLDTARPDLNPHVDSGG